MKIDPYKHKEKFLTWKEKVKNGIPDISKQNSDIIRQYISDMEKAGPTFRPSDSKPARARSSAVKYPCPLAQWTS
jgi:hypothetical protein